MMQSDITKQGEIAEELLKSKAWKELIKPDLERHINELYDRFLMAVEYRDMIAIQQRILAIKSIMASPTSRIVADNRQRKEKETL